MERPRIPTDNQIQQAEHLRTRGSVAVAARLMKPDATIPNVFPTVPHFDQKRILMASRIHVNAETSIARNSWRARRVAAHLSEAHATIQNIYRNPEVQAVANETTFDTQGHPYEFSTEMVRDEVRYLITLGQLTGNAEFLTTAIERLNSVIEQSHEPSAKTLVRFEQAQLLYQQNPSQETFLRLRASYHEAVAASMANYNWERVATIASRYILTAFKHKELHEVAEGTKAWISAARRDKNVTTILPREIYKNATQRIRERLWRQTTPQGTNYAKLAI